MNRPRRLNTAGANLITEDIQLLDRPPSAAQRHAAESAGAIVPAGPRPAKAA